MKGGQAGQRNDLRGLLLLNTTTPQHECYFQRYFHQCNLKFHARTVMQMAAYTFREGEIEQDDRSLRTEICVTYM